MQLANVAKTDISAVRPKDGRKFISSIAVFIPTADTFFGTHKTVGSADDSGELIAVIIIVKSGKMNM